MDDKLRAAFRATHYRFDSTEGELLLIVDRADARLAALLRNHGKSSAAVLTAFNPQGQRQDDASNHAAQDLLLRDLAGAGHEVLSGRNEDPGGEWPAEESVLVPGISLTSARMLAAHYGQLAFLWMRAIDGTPRLIETAACD